MTEDKEFRECDECGTVVESGFIDDDGYCDVCWELWTERNAGDVDESQEWHDFDPDC
jgi:hypothetical protein